MALYLGATHPLVLADGSVATVKELAGQTVQGIGWLVSGFRPQPITISPSAEQHSIWVLISRSGREIACARGTRFYTSNSTHSKFFRLTRRLRLPVMVVNHLAVYGSDKQDPYWLSILARSMKSSQTMHPMRMRVPDYLNQLDSTTLQKFITALSLSVGSKSPQNIVVPNIDFPDQQRLFHLLDRTPNIGSSAVNWAQSYVRVLDKFRENRVRTTRTLKTFPKKPDALRQDMLAQCYPLPSTGPEAQESYRITTQFNNLVEKSFICLTT